MKKKRQPPMVVFWPEDGILWRWNTVPMRPKLMQLFNWILWELGKRGHQVVTVTGFGRPEGQEGAPAHWSNPYEALRFSVGGLKGEEAESLARYVNDRWVHGGPPGESGKPRRVLICQKGKKASSFYAQVSDLTRPTGGLPDRVT